ncbi:MAG: hypothetical protein IJC90_02590 [Clostridia bacterium]|nr:hypothetical protein [Clostridia bacterium]
MKFLKNEKWKLEEVTRRVCLFTIIYYGVMIVFTAILYLFGFISSFIPIELYDSLGILVDAIIMVFRSIIVYISAILYLTKAIYIIPIIIAVFLISVAFIELVKRKNPRVFVHPLVLSSIAISFVGTFVIVYIVENSF